MTSPTSVRPPVVCFGELLWDSLPQGLFLGGAPFNVACHLARLGHHAVLLSAVGKDFLGDEAIRRANNAGVDTQAIERSKDLPTGCVQAELDASGNARYQILEPVAWDRIDLDGDALDLARSASALVYGSLAARSGVNRVTLDTLHGMDIPLKIIDVNLRPPFDDVGRVLALARQADVIKLNEDELGVLTGTHADRHELNDALKLLEEMTHVHRICVTRGEHGAVWWNRGQSIQASAPSVTVKDTVGSGDAFMAGLVHALLKRGKAPLEQADLDYACRLGALVASRDGANPDYDP
jgi:fructokinase